MSGAMSPVHETSPVPDAGTGATMRGGMDPGRTTDREHLAPEAVPRRVRLLVVTSLYPTPDRPEVGSFVARRVAALRRRGVAVRLVASGSYREGAALRHLRLLARAVRPGRPVDGVEGHVVFPAGSIAVLAARLRRRPCVLYAHGADVRDAARRSPVHRALASATIRLADRVVANSVSTAAVVEDLGGHAAVIPPGVDMEEFRPGDRGLARDRLGLPRDALVALYVGALIRRKGADLFADAVDRASGWLGVMVGRGELEAAIAAGHPGVRLAGPADPADVPDWMRAADVVVVPSRAEPLGLAAVEALACGIPVVAAAVDGLRDVVIDGRNGRLVPSDDVVAIAGALDALRDPAARERLAAAARASVADHDLDLAAGRMAEVWASLGVRA
jgi:glycosyltransferase involved in cell wall biosynthesis